MIEREQIFNNRAAFISLAANFKHTERFNGAGKRTKNRKVKKVMKITQCHTVLQFFQRSVFKKYGLSWYNDRRRPAIFWGCYPASQRKVISHDGLAVIVWRGSDAARLKNNQSFILWCRDHAKQIKHIAISSFIEDDLREAKLNYISLPLASMDMTDVPITPRGAKLYAYVGNGLRESYVKYNDEACKEVAIKTGITLITATNNSYTRSHLIKHIYPSAFLGLRLLEHDGLSNSVCELGMAGRNVVYNGATPNAIAYRDTKDVIEIVKREHAIRTEDNSVVRQKMVEFLNVGFDWLDTKFYV